MKEFCRGKVRYPSLEFAEAAVRAVGAREHPSRAERLHPYRCRACGSWHIGHYSAAVWREIQIRRGRRPRAEG